MFASWVVGITLILDSAGFRRGMAAASEQSAVAQKSVGGLKQSMGGVAAMGKIVDRSLIGIGIGAAATFALGIKGASELQNATVQAAIAMNKTGDTIAKTTENMRDFHDVAINMSKMTGMDLAGAMGVVATMATSGLSGANIKTDAKSIAQFVDILHFNPKDHMDYGHAAALGAGLAHDLRLFDAKDTVYGLGKVAQMGYVSPHGSEQLATQVRRMGSVLENVLPGTVQQRANTIVELAAWADRMGNLPFAGSAISQMTTQMISPRSKRVLSGLVDLGVYTPGSRILKSGKIAGENRFWDSKTQTFDIMGALRQIQGAVAQGRATGNDSAVKALFSGTQNMQRILQALTSKESLQAYDSIHGTMRNFDAKGGPAAWMDKTQTLLMNELSTQTGILTTNFKTLATLIGERFIGPLTNLVQSMVSVTGTAIDFLNAHPKTATAVGGAMLAAGGYAAVRLAQMSGNMLHAFAVISKHPHLSLVTNRLGEESAKEVLKKPGLALGARGIFDALFGFHELRKVGAKLPFSEVFRFQGFPHGPDHLPEGLGRSAATGLRGIPGVAQISRALGSVTEVLGRLSGFLLKTGSPLKFVTELFAKLGLRFVPFVGEVLLAIDALNFLRTHMKDVGFIIGQVAGWLAKNFPGIIRGAAGLAVAAMKDLMASIIAVINPVNWIHAIGDTARGIKAGYDAATAPPPPPQHVTVNVHVAPGKDAHKTGQIVGQAVAHQIAKAGQVVHAALGPGLTGARVSSSH